MKNKRYREPTFKCAVVKRALCCDKGHMRKAGKTVARSVLPSDMPRIAKIGASQPVAICFPNFLSCNSIGKAGRVAKKSPLLSMPKTDTINIQSYDH